MTLADRVIIALIFTLAAAVLALEWRNTAAPKSLQPTQPGDWNLRELNVPLHRPQTSTVTDVGFMSSNVASAAGGE